MTTGKHHQTHRNYPGFHRSLRTLQVKGHVICMYIHNIIHIYIYYIYIWIVFYISFPKKNRVMPWSSNHPTLKLDIQRLEQPLLFLAKSLSNKMNVSETRMQQREMNLLLDIKSPSDHVSVFLGGRHENLMSLTLQENAWILLRDQPGTRMPTIHWERGVSQDTPPTVGET